MSLHILHFDNCGYFQRDICSRRWSHTRCSATFERLLSGYIKGCTVLFCWCTPSFTLVLQCLRDPCLQVFPMQSYITITFMLSITTSISIIHNQILHAKNRYDAFIKEIWGQARIFNVASSLHLRMEMMGSDPSLNWHQTSQECHGNFLDVLNTDFIQYAISGLIVGFHLFNFPRSS